MFGAETVNCALVPEAGWLYPVGVLHRRL
jgi:hypothetical protein